MWNGLACTASEVAISKSTMDSPMKVLGSGLLPTRPRARVAAICLARPIVSARVDRDRWCAPPRVGDGRAFCGAGAGGGCGSRFSTHDMILFVFALNPPISTKPHPYAWHFSAPAPEIALLRLMLDTLNLPLWVSTEMIDVRSQQPNWYNHKVSAYYR